MSYDISILIVDDYNTMRRIIEMALNELGYYRIYEASNGPDALKLLSKKNIDLIISDLHMLPMTGLDLATSIKADKKLQHIPYLIVTAQPRDIPLENPFDGLIIKPFDLVDLRDKINELFHEPYNQPPRTKKPLSADDKNPPASHNKAK